MENASKCTQDTKEGFSSYLQESLMGNFRVLGVAVGHRLGLFEHLSKMEEPKSSNEIAEITGLRERYIREWLGQMVGARIVEVTPEGTKYFLPKFRSDVLCGLGLASSCSTHLHMAKLADDVTHCFKPDGPSGLEYGHTHKQLTDVILSSRRGYFERKVPRVHIPHIPRMHENLENGCRVLDVGCGYGSLVCSLAQKYPKSTFYGVDIDPDSIKTSQAEANRHQLQNVNISNLDVTSLPSDWTETFDYVILFDTLHDLPYPEKALDSLQRVMKRSGFLAVFEFNVSSNHAKNPDGDLMMELYSFSLMLCMPLSLNHEGGAGLGTAVGKEKTQELCENAGFETVHLKSPDGDPGCFQLICKIKQSKV